MNPSPPDRLSHLFERRTPAEIFGGLVRSHRQARKRSLTWLARTTGMDAGYLSRMERGRLSTLPLPDTIDRLATALELGATERRALYTAVGELTEEMYRLALRVQGSTQLYRLAIILASLPTVALLRLARRYGLNSKSGSE